MDRLFGTNGVRGIVNDRITVEMACRLGRAIGTYLHSRGDRRVLIGTDTRTSNQMLKTAVAAGVMASGCDIIDAGMAPTPALQFATREEKVCFGIIITASHNPPQFNGIKCVDADGTELPREREEEIEKLYFEEAFHSAEWMEIGQRYEANDVITPYVSSIRKNLDRELIASAGLKVVVDCANGTAGLCSPYLFESLGCKVITLNAQPDGTFPGHESEPTEKNLSDLVETVKRTGADMGIGHDGDADRSVFVDENGSWIVGDLSLALIAREMVRENGGGTVVTTVASSSCVEDVVKAEGGDLIYTRIGSPVVTRKMMETRAVFGGEESGGLIFPGHQYCKEGAMSAAKMLEILARHKRPLSEIISELPSYELYKMKTPCPDERKAKVLEELAGSMGDKEVITLDGVKIIYDDGWVLIRPSGTEPIFRVYAEARDTERAKGLAEEAMAELKRIMGE